MKEIPEAIEFFKRALDVNPRNPLCKYHLASTYVTTFQYAAAAKLLSELVEETPREAQVFFLLGKVRFLSWGPTGG
jgi:predicted Zn-dependent protease